MKFAVKLLTLLLALSMLAGCFVACDSGEKPVVDETTVEDTTTATEDSAPESGTQGEAELAFVDYASTVKFDPNSGRASATVTVRTFVDGDTTHFNISHPSFEGGILKARYLGINTPESTGQIEPWGKKASNYTKETLSKATSIIVESDSAGWNPDSTVQDRRLGGLPLPEPGDPPAGPGRLLQVLGHRLRRYLRHHPEPGREA